MTSVPEHTEYTQNECIYVGDVPVRQDMEVIPLSVLQKTIMDLKHYQWMIEDKLFPAVHDKNQEEIAQWEKEREEFMEKELEWRKSEWEAGRPTNLLTLDAWFLKPHPIPPKSGGWEVTWGDVKMVGFGGKDENI